MNMADQTIVRATRPNSLKKAIWFGLVAFIAGAVLAGMLAYRLYQQRVAELQEQPAITQTQAVTASNTRPSPSMTATVSPSAAEAKVESAQVLRVVEQQGGLDQRLAAAEQRIARLDLQTQAAAGNAARAEGLLIAFAARRAIERGAELGFLADQLRLRFGDALPNAVDTVVTFSRASVTIDQLIARLEGLGPDLSQTENKMSFDKIRSELSSLFVIRRETTPSARPARRLERARLFLESGRVEAAIAEVRGLPGAARGRAWIDDAQRLATAQRALDLIETSAVLEPRRLRTGQGQRIEQPSPAVAPTNGAD